MPRRSRGSGARWTCGALDRPTQELLATGGGLVVTQRVAKKLDLLVLADAYPLSGRARMAEQYGVRGMAERAFWLQ